MRAFHAEEVELKRGETPAVLTSTTGRHFQKVTVTPDSSFSAKETHTAPEEKFYSNFGFRVTREEKAAEDQARRRDDAELVSSMEAWEAVLSEWDSTPFARKKKLCREGIPQPLRSRVWQRLLGTTNVSQQIGRTERYIDLCHKPLADETLSGVIERDLGRTFPTHRLFEGSNSNAPGQRALRHILHAYANYNPRVGYVQGMGFLAATLLLQIEKEQDTFWAFCALMEEPRYRLVGLYEAGFPQLHCCFYVFEQLMKKKNKKVYRLLKANSIDMSFFSTHWFLTLFSYYFEYGLISEIWDMFLCEGWKPIYRVALALIALDESTLVHQTDESEMLMTLKNIQENKGAGTLLKTAKRIKFKTALVTKFSRKYYIQQNSEELLRMTEL